MSAAPSALREPQRRRGPVGRVVAFCAIVAVVAAPVGGCTAWPRAEEQDGGFMTDLVAVYATCGDAASVARGRFGAVPTALVDRLPARTAADAADCLDALRVVMADGRAGWVPAVDAPNGTASRSPSTSATATRTSTALESATPPIPPAASGSSAPHAAGARR